MVVGSNPTRSIESPVQIPKSSKSKRIKNNISTKHRKIEIQIPQTACGQTEDYKIRDLYNRADRLEYWLNRIEADLDELDKTDLLCLGRYMQDQESSYYGLPDA